MKRMFGNLPICRSLPCLVVSAALFLMAGCATPAAPTWKPLRPDDFSQPLTLARSLELARANDVRVMEWQARLDAARAGIISAKAIPNPTVSLTWEDLGLKDETGKSLATRTDAISYPIFFWWPWTKKVAAANAARRAEEEAIRA